MPGPAIIAESFPEAENLLFVGCGQVSKRREVSDESFEVGNNGGYLGLLKHHFADPNTIRITVAPPRQVAAIPPEPGQQFAADTRW